MEHQDGSTDIDPDKIRPASAEKIDQLQSTQVLQKLIDFGFLIN